MSIKLTLGQKIRLLRESRNMTQKDLAELLKISDRTLSSYECDRRPPDTGTCKQIASIFGVSLDFLLQDDICIGGPFVALNKQEEEENSYDKRINRLNEYQKKIIDTILAELERQQIEQSAVGE